MHTHFKKLSGSDGKHAFCRQETYQSLKDEAHTPGGLPFFWMVGRNAEADFLPDFESAVRGEEYDVRWFKWVIGREKNSSVVNAALEIRSLGAAYGEMPLEQVVFERFSGVFSRSVLFQLSDISMDALFGERAHFTGARDRRHSNQLRITV